MDNPAATSPPRVSFREAFLYWLKLGFINFGGPTGQIALMQQDLVETKRWISNERFVHALNYCMLLPGPEAQQLAVYIGWLLHRTIGGLVAGTLFVLPGFLLMLVLAYLAAEHGDVTWVGAVFYGIRAVVIAVVAAATIRLASRSLRNAALAGTAAAAFVAIFFVGAPFPLIVLGAGAIGFFGAAISPRTFAMGAGHGPSAVELHLAADVAAAASGGGLRGFGRSLRVLAAGLIVWWGPLLAIRAWRGPDDVLWQEALFFSKAALVTFGGAYAVLSYIAQAAVADFGWLDHAQMVTGLGLAESTPGPLILVTEYVGFLGAHRLHGDLDPVVAGILGALVTTWATFAPCFLWIFLGAPFVEKLRGERRLAGALAAIAAAVVGVIANLAVWFGIQTLFAKTGETPFLWARLPVPDLASLDLFSLALAVVAFIGMRRRKWGIIPVVLGGAAAGMAWRALS